MVQPLPCAGMNTNIDKMGRTYNGLGSCGIPGHMVVACAAVWFFLAHLRGWSGSKGSDPDHGPFESPHWSGLVGDAVGRKELKHCALENVKRGLKRTFFACLKAIMKVALF